MSFSVSIPPGLESLPGQYYLVVLYSFHPPALPPDPLCGDSSKGKKFGRRYRVGPTTRFLIFIPSVHDHGPTI